MSERILVTGAAGFLGRRVCRRLAAAGRDVVATSLRDGVDLRDPAAAHALFDAVRPAVVLHCAAFVGGIQYGVRRPAELFTHNLRIAVNLLEAAHAAGVRRLVDPIPNCVYPAQATILREDAWWDGPMHDSVLAYAFARKATWVGAWSYARQYGFDAVSLIIPNMYGPGDHFDEERSHALGALIKKIVRAHRRGEPSVIVWGSGRPIREWLHVDDGAEAVVRALDVPATSEPINVGVGAGISVIDLARMIQEVVGYAGELVLDPGRPDGAACKIVDGARGEVLLGWRPTIELRRGVEDTVAWYLAHHPEEARP